MATDATATIEDRRSFVLTELIGCMGVIAKRYEATVPGAMAQICIREIYTALNPEEVGEFQSGPIILQYRRLADLLDTLEPIALRRVRKVGHDVH
jgi:hypothetical protein